MLHRILVLLLVPVAGLGQIYLNLGFEGGSGVHPAEWFFPPCQGYDIQQDATVAYAGRQSLRIRTLVASPPFSCLVRQSLPANLVRGKHIRFSGYMKTEGVTTAPAGLEMTIDGHLYAPYDTIPQGTRDWFPFVMERDVSPSAANVSFGAIVVGNGTAWFDALKLEIDGVPYAQAPDSLGRPPTTSEIAWVMRNSIPFTTSDPLDGRSTLSRVAVKRRPFPSGNDFSDLEPLKQWIGDAHLIGIGESTHGTHEFSQMKHRMFEFLASEMGVTIFAVEANMPEAYRIKTMC